MIPTTSGILSAELTVERQPAKTYKLNIENNIITGLCDGLESMTQVVYKILNTERYASIIYSWNYGIELLDLLGEPIDYAVSELKRRITEALLQDDRITSVDEFECENDRRSVHMTFTIHTIFGDIQTDKAVEI